jgi:tetratricopeptide (TPR) repeat protein
LRLSGKYTFCMHLRSVMLEQVASAFEQKDYKTVARLLKQLLEESPDNPWVQFYVGRLHEVSGKRRDAEKIYRRLLRATTNGKIMNQARQGLLRIEEIEQEERQRAISKATSDSSSSKQGILILEPISNESKAEAAQEFAKIMQIDSYSARLMLPSRGWRFYKTGAVGELNFYGKQLQKAKIPCFWTTLAEIEKIQIFQVNYFQQSNLKPTAVCRNHNDQIGSLSFDWSEVKRRVVGLLPIFEEVVDRDVRGKVERKTQTQDYFQFCDLHIPARHCILRFYDNGYDFQEGMQISDGGSINTIRINWNNLLSWLDEKLPSVKISSDFTPFADTLLDQTEMLGQIESHIHLFRREKSNWDPAFHLYSGLIFVKNGVRS